MELPHRRLYQSAAFSTVVESAYVSVKVLYRSGLSSSNHPMILEVSGHPPELR
jgi:hypothetical protein